jgi:hypothetical protein
MMLKKKTWSVDDIIRQVHALSRECSSPYNDGFTSFECKKDLYQIQEAINRALQNSPNFGDLEKQWLTEQEQKRIIKHLKS